MVCSLDHSAAGVAVPLPVLPEDVRTEGKITRYAERF